MGLTREERFVHKAQVRQKKCQVCKNRRDLGMSIPNPAGGVDRMVNCRLGLRWPEKGICTSFDLDENA